MRPMEPQPHRAITHTPEPKTKGVVQSPGVREMNR